jgi:O-antigen/teichoic acid export membrane protein
MILRSFSIYLGVSILSGVINFIILVPITTYFLEPSDFGIAALLGVVTALVFPLSSTGSSWVLGAYFLSSRGAERKEMLFNLLCVEGSVRLFSVIALWLAADFILPLLMDRAVNAEDYKNFFRIILVGGLANALIPTISYVLILEKQPGLFGAIEVLRLVVSVFATYWIAYTADDKALMLYVPNAIAAVAVAFFTIPLILPRIKFHLSGDWILKSLKMGLPSLPGSYADNVLNSLDKIIIYRMLGLGAVGYYAHSRSYQAVFHMVTKSFTQVINPYLLEAYTENSSLHSLAKLIRYWFVILSLGGFACGLIIKDFIFVFTHGKFMAAAPLVIGWYIFSIIGVYGIPFTQYLVTKRKSMLIMKIQIFSVFVTVPAIYFGLYFIGIIGAVGAMLLGSLINQYLRYHFAAHQGCKLMFRWEIVWVSLATIGGYQLSEFWFIPQYMRILIAGFSISIASALLISMGKINILIEDRHEL